MVARSSIECTISTPSLCSSSNFLFSRSRSLLFGVPNSHFKASPPRFINVGT